MNRNSTASSSKPPVVVVAIEMGYGHLRPAYALADYLGVPVLMSDRAPLADASEQRRWALVRYAYETVSRMSHVPWVGAPMRRVLDSVTSIPHLFPLRDLSGPTTAAVLLDTLITRYGLGHGLVQHLRHTGGTLLTTFYAPAVAADRLGASRVFCLVTDTDLNRIWVPVNPSQSGIHYLAPSHRAIRRLRSYGVPAKRIHFTGFPLPDSLLGGREVPVLRRNLAARLVRLDPEGTFRRETREDIGRFLGDLPEAVEGRPPHLVFAVGGAGAQADLPRLFLPGFRRMLLDGRLRMTLVAGVRQDVEERLYEAVLASRLEDAIGRGLTIWRQPDLASYYRAMEGLLAETDILFTKPSEMVFFAALGIPLILSWPVGVHERYNRRWAQEHGVGLRQRDPRFIADHLAEWLADGTLAAAAWSGFLHLPKRGLYEIAALVSSAADT